MLTIFTVPKPFEGHIGMIQRNAILSWTKLRPPCQALLCGEEAGEEAEGLGAERIVGVERNEFGTPLLNSVFAAVESRARHDLLCYVNADILLLSDFLEAARRIAAVKRRFLMVGQRWDLDVTEPLPFERDDCEAELRRRVQHDGTLHPPSGSDYFVYRRGTIGPLPPFAVGRPGWDNWMIYRARSLRLPVIDATQATLVIHQNHGYGHIRRSSGSAWEGPEADRNFTLIGGRDFVFTLTDATHRLTATRITPALSAAHLRRRARTAVLLAPPLWSAYRLLRSARRALRGRPS